jgi:hypothetical protein
VARDWPDSGASVKMHNATIPEIVPNVAISRLVITVDLSRKIRRRLYLATTGKPNGESEWNSRPPGSQEKDQPSLRAMNTIYGLHEGRRRRPKAPSANVVSGIMRELLSL